MRPAFTVSQTSIKLRGRPVPGAEDRQRKITGFDQEIFSKASVVCIGAGGLISNVAPTLVRKGIGRITILDDDIVEASNLNRQRFYPKDLGKNKAIALAENLQDECIATTDIIGIPLRLEDVIARGMDLTCQVAVCGVDNNSVRVVASRHFRARGTPVVFSAVSADANHGYVFVQEKSGACLACLFPDIVNDDRYPCPGTPAIADILQLIGALSVFATDSLLMDRSRGWNYRRIALADGSSDGSSLLSMRQGCLMFPADRH